MLTANVHFLERRNRWGGMDVHEFRVRGESVTVVSRIGRSRKFETMGREAARALYASLKRQGFRRW